MRILRIHNRYQERGGEDVCFDAEVRLLQNAGDEVRTLVVSNDAIPTQRSLMEAAKLARSTVWSRSGEQLIAEAIREFVPDVAHFDNTFPLLSPSAYHACLRMGVPVVQTLHNYRPLCPNVMFFRDNHTCEDCLGKAVPLPGIIHKCYRDSRSQTAAVAAMITVHRLRGTWTHDVDRYITMTEFERSKFIEGGFPPDRIVIKPHFVDVPRFPTTSHRSGFLVVGRLTSPKGIPTLITAWAQIQGARLIIVGDGPMSGDVQEIAARNPSIEYLGRKSSEDILRLMSGVEALIAPTQMYETFGRVAIEAFAQGTPVIASSIGATGEVVTHGKTGLHFSPGDGADLARKIRWALNHPSEMRQMGERARAEYMETFTPSANYQRLMEIYDEAKAVAQRRQGHRPVSQRLLRQDGITP
jgi:glycosyltransferase involved in cell wall biosynthesis